MNSIELAQIALDYARTTVRDLVAQAYDAGQTSHDDVPERDSISKPESTEIEKALADLERRTVELAHARMEETAKLCGFEGLTEALGYLITLRDNPVASLLREAVNLAATPPVPVSNGWADWYKRAKAVVGDTTPPPETITIHTATGEALDRKFGMRPEQQVLSGCAVRAAIQGDEAAGYAAEEAEHNARINYAWDFYGLPRTRLIGGHPIYYWAGREGRPSTNRYRKNAEGLPTGCEHVLVDETRGDPAGAAPVCRIVESIEPLSLGHTLCISREELQPLEDGAWVPKHPAPGEPGCGNNPDCSCHGIGGTTTSKN